jgi:ubiquitin-activating enzyme E1
MLSHHISHHCCRCRAFGIRDVTRAEVHQLTGNIIPAVVTSTAVVAGLATLELLKVVQQMTGRTAPRGPLDTAHRNHYIDLKQPTFSHTELVPAELYPLLLTKSMGSSDGFSGTFTMWDKIEVTRLIIAA